MRPIVGGRLPGSWPLARRKSQRFPFCDDVVLTIDAHGTLRARDVGTGEVRWDRAADDPASAWAGTLGDEAARPGPQQLPHDRGPSHRQPRPLAGRVEVGEVAE